MIIRAATKADAAAIADIWNLIIRDPAITFTDQEKSPEGIEQMITQRDKAGQGFLVVETRGVVSGFATYGGFRAGPGYRHTAELTIILAEKARSGGVGRKLMQALQEQAHGQGVHVMIAAISAQNPAAIAFHAAMGFEVVGRLPQVGRKQDRWLDLVLMQKVLDT